MKKMTTKLQKMINITKKMSNSDFKILMDYMDAKKFTKSEIEYLGEEHARKNISITTGSKKQDWVSKEYAKEINKITFLLNDDKLLGELGKIAILFYGKTGTGKTTLINKIGVINKKYDFEYLNLESIVSSKMGQTQINLLTFADKLNLEKKSKTIIFIDEIDSIVNTRINNNDVGEHARIVSTFIKFLDRLNTNIVVMAATNVENNIDKAIIRRFNMQIKSRTMSKKTFLKLIANDHTTEFSTNEINFLEMGLDEGEFTISEFDRFIKNTLIEKRMDNSFDAVMGFLEFFKNNMSFKGKDISERKRVLLKKVGIDV